MKLKVLLILAVVILTIPAMAQEDPEKLLDKKVSVNFEETKFSEAIALFSAQAKIDFTIDPALQDLPPVTMTLTDLSLRDSLALLVALVNPKLGWDLRWGGIFVGMKNRLELLPKTVPGEGPGLEKKVKVHFDETPLPDVLEFLKAISGTTISIDPQAAALVKNTMVSIKCNDATLRDSLSRILFPANLAFVVEDGKVKVVPAMIKRALSPEETVRSRLKETKVNLSFEETSILDALGFLSQYADVNVYIDPMLFEQRSEDDFLVTLKADDITVQNALDLITLTKSISYDVRFGGIFVADAARLKAIPKTALAPPTVDQPAWERKLRKLLESRITFSFDGATVPQALDFIRTLKGVNIVLSPEAQKVAESLECTQTVNGIPIVDAIALLVLPHGLKMELKSEVLLISVAK